MAPTARVAMRVECCGYTVLVHGKRGCCRDAQASSKYCTVRLCVLFCFGYSVIYGKEMECKINLDVILIWLWCTVVLEAVVQMC